MGRATYPIAVAVSLLVGGCAGLRPAADAPAQAVSPVPANRPTDFASYLEVLAGMAPGDTARQQVTLEGAFAASQQALTSANRLRYALAVGSAGSATSNPVEARRLLAELLAGANDLTPEERVFAAGFLREFDARVTLYAELARQREEAKARIESLDASVHQRVDVFATDNARLKRALAEAERKLEAVAEMERQLLEQPSEPAPATSPP